MSDLQYFMLRENERLIFFSEPPSSKNPVYAHDVVIWVEITEEEHS